MTSILLAASIPGAGAVQKDTSHRRSWGLAKLTTATDGAQTEIAILAYPKFRLAAIHGLTDLFVEASRILRELGGTASHILRVTQRP